MLQQFSHRPLCPLGEVNDSDGVHGNGESVHTLYCGEVVTLDHASDRAVSTFVDVRLVSHKDYMTFRVELHHTVKCHR